MSNGAIIAWTATAFMVAAVLAGYLFLVGHEQFAYFIVMAGYFVVMAGIYKEKG